MREVTSFTEPAQAEDLASGSEAIKGQAVLVLAENGWIRASMFGK